MKAEPSFASITGEISVPETQLEKTILNTICSVLLRWAEPSFGETTIDSVRKGIERKRSSGILIPLNNERD